MEEALYNAKVEDRFQVELCGRDTERVRSVQTFEIKSRRMQKYNPPHQTIVRLRTSISLFRFEVKKIYVTRCTCKSCRISKENDYGGCIVDAVPQWTEFTRNNIIKAAMKVAQKNNAPKDRYTERRKITREDEFRRGKNKATYRVDLEGEWYSPRGTRKNIIMNFDVFYVNKQDDSFRIIDEMPYEKYFPTYEEEAKYLNKVHKFLKQVRRVRLQDFKRRLMCELDLDLQSPYVQPILDT